MNVLIPTGNNRLWFWVRTTNYVGAAIKLDRSDQNIQLWNKTKTAQYPEIKNYSDLLGRFYKFH